MTTLQAELHRLFLPDNPVTDTQNPAGSGADLINASGHVRAMVLEVGQLAGCGCAMALWHSVQDALGLPAPAMAVSGISGYQVWFSLQEPVPIAQARAFLDLLRLRYLADVAPQHVAVWPTTDVSGPARHAQLVPALQPETGQWSAFVVPGLLSLFANEPWLDVPPSPEAQARQLSIVQSIQPAQLQQALAQLQPAPSEAAPDVGMTAADPGRHQAALKDAHSALYDTTNPKHFLLAVMNDPGAELALRIEAAKALLPYPAES